MTGELGLVTVDREAQRLNDETWVGERQACVVVLRSRGLQYAEIAQVMGVARGTVSRHLHDVRSAHESRRDDLVWLWQNGYTDLLNRDLPDGGQ